MQTFLANNEYRVVAIDLLGFGDAPKPDDSQYTYGDHVSYIRKVLKDLKIHKPVSIIGHSMGGLLGARLTALYPNEVNRLILLHPPLYDSSEQAHKTIHATGRLYRFVLTSRLRHFAWKILRPLSLFIIGNHTAVSRERSFDKIVLGGEIFKDLDRLKRRTLLLIGSRDRPQYLLNLGSRRLNKLVTLRIEDVGHHSALFHKKLVRKAILDFLDN